MGYDFRVESTWRTHPKFILLRQLYGSEGIDAIFTLWAFVAEERNKGVLENMSDRHIAAACCIDPKNIDPSEFVANLVEIGFLDRREDRVVVVHNWDKRQPNIWARGEKNPAKVAAANARWQKNDDSSSVKTKKKHGVENADAPAMQCMGSAMPHPIPSYLKSLSLAPDGERARELVFGLMSESSPRARPKAPDKWPAMLLGLLEAGHSLEEIERATRFALQDAFWRSRILSAKAYRENFAQILDQAVKAEEPDPGCNEEGRGQGMSAEAWEELKKKNRVQHGVSNAVVKSMPP
jgi:hypothetical protein